MAENLSPMSNSLNIDKGSSNEPLNVFHCYICMEPPKKPVAGVCGHIFCWPCIYQWLEDEPKPCPICRHLLDKDQNIIPLYSGGNHVEPINQNINKVQGDEDALPSPSNLLLFKDTLETLRPQCGSPAQDMMFRRMVATALTIRNSQRELIFERTKQVRDLEMEKGNLEHQVQCLSTRMYDLEMERDSLRLRVRDLENDNVDN